MNNYTLRPGVYSKTVEGYSLKIATGISDRLFYSKLVSSDDAQLLFDRLADWLFSQSLEDLRKLDSDAGLIYDLIEHTQRILTGGNS